MTKQVQIIGQKEFTTVALDLDEEAFIVYVVSLSLDSKITIHLIQEAQIALLIVEKVTIPTEYLDFTDGFSKKSATELSECSTIN